MAYHTVYECPGRETTRLNGSRARLLREAAGGYFFGHHADPYAGLEVERERRRRGLREAAPVPADGPDEPLPELRGVDASRLDSAGWESWVRAFFSSRLAKPFAPHHRQLWEWAWSVKKDVRPRPFVLVLPRGGGKSQNAELVAASLLVRGIRRYCVYVCLTQDQANDRVANIARLLETPLVSAHYPEATSRGVSKYGHPRAWRRDRLVTKSGAVLDGLGLDVAGARGLKEDELRPDLFILDELDGLLDSQTITDRKVKILTRTILPLGAGGKTVVLAVQNLMIPDGIFARLVKRRVRFLADRIVVGPIPAIRNLVTKPVEGPDGTYRDVIVSGEPTWPEGQGLEVCQAEIDNADLESFLCELQHEVEAPEGALWKEHDIRRVAAAPAVFTRVNVGVDPSGGRAETGIVCVGKGADGKVYVLDDVSQLGADGPDNWACAAVEVYLRRKANAIVAETNFGGDLVASNVRGHVRRLAEERDCGHDGVAVHVAETHSARGKDIRAEPVAAACRRGEILFVGEFPSLERELRYWVPRPGSPSPNRLDAFVFACKDLIEPTKTVQSSASPRPPGY